MTSCERRGIIIFIIIKCDDRNKGKVGFMLIFKRQRAAVWCEVVKRFCYNSSPSSPLKAFAIRQERVLPLQRYALDIKMIEMR